MSGGRRSLNPSETHQFRLTSTPKKFQFTRFMSIMLKTQRKIRARDNFQVTSKIVKCYLHIKTSVTCKHVRSTGVQLDGNNTASLGVHNFGNENFTLKVKTDYSSEFWWILKLFVSNCYNELNEI